MDKITREMQSPDAQRGLEYKEQKEWESRPELLLEKIGLAREKLVKIIDEHQEGDFFNQGIGEAGKKLSDHVFEKQGRGINNLSLSEIDELKEKLGFAHYENISLLIIAEAYEAAQRDAAKRH
ncbi:MAG: hypothetical protein UV36_C0022G0003 [Parcubacteria group bacterium GW2011_GWC2_42_6]|nr:MAG: hypothetical protein UU87_C0004G0006 [Parcubacteria group bacterium GW2011_GWA2_42_11]KKS66543.1 MAG: hypothetical protein UV36_C0022G0003 [Parcubacteria group bacterium GW2011_GWC2_42_6]KKT76588.1 MAG: hypothetical protein UW72_C0004G0009 [Parcubacteria group bacterium GW2011_GWF2_44_7]